MTACSASSNSREGPWADRSAAKSTSASGRERNGRPGRGVMDVECNAAAPVPSARIRSTVARTGTRLLPGTRVVSTAGVPAVSPSRSKATNRGRRYPAQQRPPTLPPRFRVAPALAARLHRSEVRRHPRDRCRVDAAARGCLRHAALPRRRPVSRQPTPPTRELPQKDESRGEPRCARSSTREDGKPAPSLHPAKRSVTTANGWTGARLGFSGVGHAGMARAVRTSRMRSVVVQGSMGSAVRLFFASAKAKRWSGTAHPSVPPAPECPNSRSWRPPTL